MVTVKIVAILALYAVCSAVLVVYGVQCYVMTLLFLKRRSIKLREQRSIMRLLENEPNELAYPCVVTQLPMYNERSVAARVIEAAAMMDYPVSRHEVQVLDDSTDSTREIIDSTAERMNAAGRRVRVIRRDNREGYKAGALQNGLSQTDSDFVAIFDSDFVPPADFLRKAMCFFKQNPELGLVQGRWTHLNRDASLLTRGQAMGLDGHFMVEQAGRAWNNLFMNFNGTAGVFRRAAIEDSGGWHHDTLTEDLDLSYRMQIRGWRTEYVPDIVVPAEIPEDINSFKNQQYRWAKGSIQTARKILPSLLRGDVPAFTLCQAFLHLTYYMVHPFAVLLAVLTPIVLAFYHRYDSPLFLVPVATGMAVSTLGPAVMYITAQHALGNRSIGKYLMIVPLMFIGIGLAVNNTWAVVDALRGTKTPFHRTPKKGDRGAGQYRPIRDITCVAELALGVYALVAFNTLCQRTGLWVAPFLLVYASSFLFMGLLSVAHNRCPAGIDCKVRFPRFARAAS